MKAIDPSEIIVGKGRGGGAPIGVHPWLRFLARFFDYALWVTLLGTFHFLFGGKAPLAQYEWIVPYQFVTWIPIEATLLYLWGTTPGKSLLCIQIRQGRRERFDMGSALRRSFFVWFRGLGMMIPVVNLFCFLLAYKRLKVRHSTSWDEEDRIVVSHQFVARWRITLAGLVVGVVAIKFSLL